MNIFDWICLAVSIICVFGSIYAIYANRKKTVRILDRVSLMLEKAKSGEFTERDFDETRISALESSFAEYLSSSQVLSKSLQEEKDKIKELISDISHQTKTPISNVLLFSQLLQEQQDLSQESRECADQLLRQGENLSFLINALVKTSRLETRIFSLEPRKNEICQLIELAVDDVREKAGKKNIKLIIKQSQTKACFDMKWTKEALFNVLDNAVKYTGENGTVWIETKQFHLFCRVDVRDNGIGISEEDHAKIFKRFYRSKDVCQEDGTGIGLYLCREILSRENGYIKVSSSKGSGTVFSIYLPMENIN